MKKLLIIAATALTGLFLMPATAEAGHPGSSSSTYRCGYASCGCPTYTKRYFRGYDSCRRPIYAYTRLALTHGSSCRLRSHRSHYSNSNYYRPSSSAYYRSSRYVPRSNYYRGGYGSSRCR